MFGGTKLGRRESDHKLFLKPPSIMNKLPRRPRVTVENSGNNNNKGGAAASYQSAGLWDSCFNLLVSPTIDSYWADCLRYVCSIERRSQYRTSKANGNRSNSVALVVSQPPHLSDVMSSSSRLNNTRQQKPRVVLSFLSWEQRDRDMRGLLSQVLRADSHFAEGHVLNAIEADAAEEMGEPLLWYPVAHVRGTRLGANMHPREAPRHDRKLLGGHFTLLQDVYYEHTKLTLMLDKGLGSPGASMVGETPSGGGGRTRNLLVLAYKSLEDVTDPGLLAGWVRWSGAWEAYTLLQEKRLAVASITLYVREVVSSVPSNSRRRRPRESFKYVVVVEVMTTGAGQEQQLRAATQRLRVERWSGYTGLYTLHSLQDFVDSFSSSDSISRMVADL